ncbi:hypothetical protein BDQ12DRAFT_471068 [Crucibulum laeve]|uniref:Uncharacterized protein n=1 Tax=Crucibulum laeve TaxID=68775 RepID=A0A5C3LIJ9_9AGAR|nr:hypothetical protein BDQ12DRAFT_471068 [Crucibulum laeve]
MWNKRQRTQSATGMSPCGTRIPPFWDRSTLFSESNPRIPLLRSPACFLSLSRALHRHNLNFVFTTTTATKVNMPSSISTTPSQVSPPTTSQILPKTRQQDAVDNTAISELLQLSQPPISVIASQTSALPAFSSTLKSKPADNPNVLVQGCTDTMVTTYDDLLVYLLVLSVLGLLSIIIVRSLFSLLST